MNFDTIALGMIQGEKRMQRIDRQEFERDVGVLHAAISKEAVEDVAQAAQRLAASDAVRKLIQKLPSALDPRVRARLIELGGPISQDVGDYMKEAEENLGRLSNGTYTFGVTDEQVERNKKSSNTIHALSLYPEKR